MALRPYLELIRLPAVFTAPADVLAGAALALAAGGDWNLNALLLAVGASVCIYCAGMAANDVFDREVDARERPGRPIPSGRVSLGQAWALVLGLQGMGLALAALVGTPTLIAVAATIACTYLYDAVLKDHLLGTVTMGLCRYGNALIGVSLAGWAVDWIAFAAPAGTILYVTALTTLSRHEVDGATRAQVTGPLVALVGFALLPAVWPLAGLLPEPLGALCVLLPFAWLIRPARAARQAPGAGPVRGAVMAGIFGIAMVNAALAAGAGQWILAAIIVGLLVPGRAVGRWFYAT